MLRLWLFLLLVIWLPDASGQVSAPSFCGNQNSSGFFEIEIDGAAGNMYFIFRMSHQEHRDCRS